MRDEQQISAVNIEHALELLKGQFGYLEFRPGQAELVDAILQGRDCVGVMPTGAGKSICYQVPALAFAFGDASKDSAGEGASKASISDDAPMASVSGGYGGGENDKGDLHDSLAFRACAALTLVISPLVSLMSDQVMALKSAGIPAAYLNSQLTPRQQEEVLSRARAGAYALMYVAPERLDDPRFLDFVGARSLQPEQPADATLSAASPKTPIPIPLVAVDEAHCVSQWGQDFRPSYLGISRFIAKLPTRPIVAAFTATATPRVAADIERLLELRNPLNVTTGFDRPNLRFEVEQLTDKKKLARVVHRALANPDDSGIVYCSTRKDVERVHEALVVAGVPATRYHAGLSNGEREANQRAFVNDDAPVIVATNAFGMGIDKSNVRYVVHFNMPGSLEAYYQEAGRAGRDGEPSDCVLMWNDSDIATCRFFIEQESVNDALSFEEQQSVRASQRRRLAAMVNYCMTCDCLRATILRYFGENVSWENGGAGFEAGAQGGMRSETPLEAGRQLDARLETPLEAGMKQGMDSETPPEPEAQLDTQPIARYGVQLDAQSGTANQPGVANQLSIDAFNCGNCSNCTGEIDAVDVTKTARSVMRCVHELRGRFGKTLVCDTLCGSKSAKIYEYGLDLKKTYNIVDDSAAVVKEIIELLTAGEYLEISDGRYPLVGLGPRAREAATDEFRLFIKKHRKASERKQATGKYASRVGAGAFGAAGGIAGSVGTGAADAAAADGIAGATGVSAGTAYVSAAGTDASAFEEPLTPKLSPEEQQDLFEQLRQLRKRLADEEGMPPYIVFSDATLRAMCAALPTTEDEFLSVSGVGPTKLKRYGAAFLAEINAFANR